MILNFIIVLVFLVLFLQLPYEGFVDNTGEYDPDPPFTINCGYDNINIILPTWDVSTNSYIDNNNFLFNNYENIIKFANMPCP